MLRKNTLTQGRKRKGDEAAIAGRLDEARELFESACRSDPSDVEARVKLGMVLKRLGDYIAAEVECRKAVLLQPKLGFAHFGLGNALQCQGRVDEAIASYGKTTQLQPDFPDGHYLLGNALHDVGAKVDAILSYRKALALRPDFPAALSDLAGIYIDLGDLDEAAPLLERALALQPDNRVAMVNRSHLLRLLGKVEDAISVFRHALILLPDSVEVRSGLSGMLERTGHIDEAERLVSEGLEMQPDDPSLNIVAARLDRRAKRVGVAIARLERLQTQIMSVDLQAELCLLLGQLYDQDGNAERAYPHIVEGKRLKALATTRDAADRTSYLGRVFRIASLVTEGKQYRAVVSEQSPVDTPVFMIGFPRSGTTLLEQMLDSHPSLQSMEEVGAVAAMTNRFLSMTEGREDALNSLQPSEVTELREVYFQMVLRHVQVRPNMTLVDKMPLNTVGVPVIWKVFPEAKYILAIRHPCDACLSCLMQDFATNEGMASFFSLEDTVRTYAAVMGAWQKYVKNLPLAYHRIRYEDLIADVEGQMRLLLDFLGVGWSDAVLEYTAYARNKGTINTPSYHQVIQPIYQSAKYRWKRYETVFDPVMDQLQPFIEYFDYGSK